jgi:REP element-mobilizing transposase RayT
MAADRPKRQSLRLAGFDYRENGAYFFTIVTKDRASIFGAIRDEAIQLNAAGRAILGVWQRLPDRFPSVGIDEFVVMPDHVHGILFLNHTTTEGMPSLSDVLGAFKSISAREVNAMLARSGALWQRGFYDRVVRGDRDLDQLRTYVDENPVRWAVRHDH